MVSEVKTKVTLGQNSKWEHKEDFWELGMFHFLIWLLVTWV